MRTNAIPAQPPDEAALRRRQLRDRSDCRFVPPDVFQGLLVSRRPLDRDDDARAGVLGLRDRATGRRYLVESERFG